eukprot:3680484-Rhodomonas_salina.2
MIPRVWRHPGRVLCDPPGVPASGTWYPYPGPGIMMTRRRRSRGWWCFQKRLSGSVPGRPGPSDTTGRPTG